MRHFLMCVGKTVRLPRAMSPGQPRGWLPRGSWSHGGGRSASTHEWESETLAKPFDEGECERVEQPAHAEGVAEGEEEVGHLPAVLLCGGQSRDGTHQVVEGAVKEVGDEWAAEQGTASGRAVLPLADGGPVDVEEAGEPLVGQAQLQAPLAQAPPCLLGEDAGEGLMPAGLVAAGLADVAHGRTPFA